MSSGSIADKGKVNPARKVCANNPGTIRHSYSFPRILLANVRSLVNKMEELQIILGKNQIDIACPTETWSATEDSCSIPNYDSHFKPRLDKDGIPLSHGGGVAFFCKCTLPNRILSFSEIENNSKTEVLWLWTRPKNLPKDVSCMIFCIIYYPPRSGFKKELTAYLQLYTDRIRHKYPYAAITLCGDFNELDQKWLSAALSLDQVVKSPTRSDKTLDLIFTNVEDYYSAPKIAPPLGASDHLCIFWTPLLSFPPKPLISYSYRPITDEKIAHFKVKLSSKSWANILCLTNGDEMASKFSAELFQLYCDTFPVKKVSYKSNCKPWINKKILCLTNERDRLFKEGFFQESRKLRNIIISEIRKARKEHGAHVLNKLLCSNPKNLHKCIQDLMGKVSSKFLLLDSNGNPVSADIINDYFSSTCRTHPPLQNMPANSAVSDIPVIRIHQTQLKLENLDTNKSVYPGDIPTKLIVKCAHYLSVPLTAIFKQCLVDGIEDLQLLSDDGGSKIFPDSSSNKVHYGHPFYSR
ncbi:uncharacterized protein LOC136038402 [Artemia franciscana]|uniref:uncharacterized protein LOC136038402 n=1 Tax=Artemia franciscana TaxID=6661 RepID=UPI0032DBCB95